MDGLNDVLDDRAHSRSPGLGDGVSLERTWPGTQIRRAREGLRMTQSELGQLIGRPQSVVSRWERRTLEPTIEDLAAVATALATPLGNLLDRALPGPGRRRSRRGLSAEGRRRFGHVLRSIREDAGLDPYTVARAARIPPRRLRQIEEGAQPGLDEVDRLLGAIGVASSSLVGRNIDKPIHPSNFTPDLRPE